MRISGITIPDKKRLDIGLTAVFGIGRARAAKALADAKIDPGKKPGDLSAKDEAAIRERIEAYAVEGDLRREVSGNIKRQKDIKSYRGMRHARNLPVRGQRTKTNSRTVRPYKGKKTMGSGKRKVEKK